MLVLLATEGTVLCTIQLYWYTYHSPSCQILFRAGAAAARLICICSILWNIRSFLLQADGVPVNESRGRWRTFVDVASFDTISYAYTWQRLGDSSELPPLSKQSSAKLSTVTQLCWYAYHGISCQVM